MSLPAGSRQRPGVAPVRAAALSFSVLIRQIVTPGKLIALGFLGLAMIVIAWPVARAVERDSAVERNDYVEYGSEAVAGEPAEALLEAMSDAADARRVDKAVTYADVFGLVFIVPIVSMVFATAVLGDPREDGTLVYLWLRPMGRGAVVAGAAAAAGAVALPLTVVPTVVSAWIVSGGVTGSTAVLVGAFAASALGSLAYSSLFVLVGLILRKPVFWGIGFVLLWEGLAAGLGDAVARLSLRGYIRSLLANVADVPVGFHAYATTVCLIVLAAVSLAALLLATLRLNRMEVA